MSPRIDHEHSDGAGRTPADIRPEDQPTLEHRDMGEIGVGWKASAVSTASAPVKIVGRSPRLRPRFRLDR